MASASRKQHRKILGKSTLLAPGKRQPPVQLKEPVNRTPSNIGSGRKTRAQEGNPVKISEKERAPSTQLGFFERGPGGPEPKRKLFRNRERTGPVKAFCTFVRQTSKAIKVRENVFQRGETNAYPANSQSGSK